MVAIKVNTMRFFAFILSLQTLSSSLYCNGFTYPAPKTSLPRAFDGMSNPLTALKSGRVNEQHDTEKKMPISIAATTALTLGLWAISASPSLASPPIIPTAPSSSSSSSLNLAAEYSASDFTDFSMPSYQEALTSELNTNLKGGKPIFGEEEPSASSTSAPAATAAPQKKEPTAAELKAEKAAAKAAQKAAREAQQAAVEAAIAAK